MTDLGSFVLFNVYFPNGGKGPERIQFKLEFYKAFQNKIEELLKLGKRVVFVGDVNTAHRHIDTHNPETKATGFLPEERSWMNSILGKPAEERDNTEDVEDKTITPLFIDSLRYVHKDTPNLYTWWDPKTFKRSENRGWRIDYGIVSSNFTEDIDTAGILSDVQGSDHCPIFLKLKDQPIPPPHDTPALSSRKFRKKQGTLSDFFSSASKKSDSLNLKNKETTTSTTTTTTSSTITTTTTTSKPIVSNPDQFTEEIVTKKKQEKRKIETEKTNLATEESKSKKRLLSSFFKVQHATKPDIGD